MRRVLQKGPLGKCHFDGILVRLSGTHDAAMGPYRRPAPLQFFDNLGVRLVDDLAHLPEARSRSGAARPIAPRAIGAAVAALNSEQPLNARTRAVHAAAWCGRDGAIRTTREDVGRHNALDKLIGALLRAKADPDDGFILISSRCSFEMVAKAAAFGAGIPRPCHA